MTTTKTKLLLAQDVAFKLNEGQLVNGNWGLEELEPGFQGKLEALLAQTGWTVPKTYDHCSKASRESNWWKDGIKVNVLTANFLGTFTQVSAYHSNF